MQKPSSKPTQLQPQDIINIPTPSPVVEKNWISEARIIYGGLAGMGLIMIQPFIGNGEPTDLAAKICVSSFAISIPLLAALFLLNHEETFRKRLTKSIIVEVTKSIALLAATVGFIAGLWHISPLAGKVAIASCILAASAHSAGYAKLYMNEIKSKKL